MSFRTSKSPMSKRPWKRSFDLIDTDARYPKFQPCFKRPKVDGFQKFPEHRALKCGIRERSARRFTDAKTCRRSTASHVAIAPLKPLNYRSRNYHAPRREFNDSDRRLAFKAKSDDVVANGVPLKHGAVSSKLKSSSQQALSRSWERRPSKGREKVSFHQENYLQDVVSQKPQVEPKPLIGTGHDRSVENVQIRSMVGLKVPKNILQENALKSPANYKGDAFHTPHSRRFNDSDRRLAFKDTSNDVVGIGVPLKHDALSGKLKSSSQQSPSRSWERRPSKGREKVSFPREISLQDVVSQKSQVEPKPSIGTGHDRSVENEVQIMAMVGLKVPKNILQKNALKSPANYKGDAFQDFSYCHAFNPVISEIKSQDSDEAEAYGSSGIAAGLIKSAASRNLNHKLGKVDDSGQEMTSEAKLDGVAENRIWLRQVSVLDTLRTSSQEDVSSPIYAPQSGACVKQESNVEQKPAIAVTCAHSIENGAHARAMTLTKVPKNVVRENSLKCHAHSGDLVNQKSNATTLKDTVDSHDRIIEVTTEVKRMIGSNVLKNTSEENSSKCHREPSSVLNGESCKMARVENTFGSKPHAEEDKASFSFLGKYSGQEPNLKPLDLRHQDDEKMVRSLEENRKGKIAEEMDAIDLESSLVDNGIAEQLSRQVTDCEAIPGNCGYQEQVGFQHLFSDKIIVVNMQGEARVSERTFNNDAHRWFYYVADHGVADDHIQKLKQLKDCIVLISDRYHAHDSRKRVIQVLELFKDVYTVRSKAYKAEQNHGNAIQKIDVRTAMALKYEQKWVNYERVFVGHVPGVYIGDQFRFRAELAIVGLHHTFCSGIHYVKIQGENYAISIVDSGRYENRSISPNSFIYVGHGGNPSIAGKEPVDQKLKYGNLALKNSRDKGVPVRVVRACHVQHEDSNSNTLGTSNKRYIYEGLFVVTRYWQERVQHGKMAFMFELHRMSNQPSFTHQMSFRPKKVGGWYHRQALKRGRPFLNGNRTCGVFKSSLKKSTMRCQALERVVVDDVSQGKENLAIRVVSDIYAERPPPFTYTVNMIYPDWYHPSLPLGCDCTDRCSDSRHCFCAFRNGGEIPFNSHGAIIKPKPVIYECGPSCKCPPSCRNRVSQRGLRYHLEIFRKKPSGWGVRSRDYISAGSFICEFIGELLDKEEAEKRIDHSEYFFHIGNSEKDAFKGKATLHDSCTAMAHLSESSSSQRNDGGYKIDAACWGNVARFINRSSSPNLYVQNVLYDDDYEDAPHIMLFACKNIPPMQEFTYHCNYRDESDDANSNPSRC